MRALVRSVVVVALVFSSMTIAAAAPFAVPLIANAPLGSLIYSGASPSAAIGSAGELDVFMLSVDAGQTITIDVIPGTTLQPTVALKDPSNATLGAATASSPGQEALLQTVPTTTGGTYTIAVSGAAATTGSYSLRVILNAALENESHGGPGNGTLATAQD